MIPSVWLQCAVLTARGQHGGVHLGVDGAHGRRQQGVGEAPQRVAGPDARCGDGPTTSGLGLLCRRTRGPRDRTHPGNVLLWREGGAREERSSRLGRRRWLLLLLLLLQERVAGGVCRDGCRRAEERRKEGGKERRIDEVSEGPTGGNKKKCGIPSFPIRF